MFRHFFVGRILDILGLIVMWGDFDQPLSLYGGHASHVLLGGKGEFMVQQPPGKLIEGWGGNRDGVVIGYYVERMG